MAHEEVIGETADILLWHSEVNKSGALSGGFLLYTEKYRTDLTIVQVLEESILILREVVGSQIKTTAIIAIRIGDEQQGPKGFIREASEAAERFLIYEYINKGGGIAVITEEYVLSGMKPAEKPLDETVYTNFSVIVVKLERTTTDITTADPDIWLKSKWVDGLDLPAEYSAWGTDGQQEKGYWR